MPQTIAKTVAEVERVFRVNFLAPYALIRAVLPGRYGAHNGRVTRGTGPCIPSGANLLP